MTEILFLYHDPCTDGFLCRVIAEYYYAHTETFGGRNVIYAGVNPSCLAGDLERILADKQFDLILMFDVSLTKEHYEQMKNHAKEVRVYDHHESTAKAFNPKPDWLFFDNHHCGSYLAFQYFFGSKTIVPLIVEYVQVRDIWLYGTERDLSDSKEITTYLYSDWFRLPFLEPSHYFPLLFNTDNLFWAKAAMNGRIILADVDKRVDQIVAQMKLRPIQVNGTSKNVNIVQTSEYISEVGNKAIKTTESDFALMWSYDTENRIRISLRSDSTRCNVNDVAKTLWNGGGHAAASGALLSNQNDKEAFLKLIQ